VLRPTLSSAQQRAGEHENELVIESELHRARNEKTRERERER